MRIIAGTAKGITLFSPNGMSTRPMLDRVKEALFNILGDTVIERQVLDLFAGTGALGLEALSRGAQMAYFIEKSKETYAVLQRNIEKCKMHEKSQVIQHDAFHIIPRLHGQCFDILFFDPPYHYFDQPETRRHCMEYLAQLAQEIMHPGACLVLHYRRGILQGLPLPRPLMLQDNRMYGHTELLFLQVAQLPLQAQN